MANVSKTKKTLYKVKVGETIPTGEHDKPWVVTWPTNAKALKTFAKPGKSRGSITFDPTDKSVWSEDSPPVRSDFLVADVRSRKKGWYAVSIRPFTAEDIDDPNIVQ